MTTYIGSSTQRIDALRDAAALISRCGFTPRPVNTSDTRSTVVHALAWAVGQFSNQAEAMADLLFLAHGRMVLQRGALLPWETFTWEWSTDMAEEWLTDLSNLVADAAASAAIMD